jgi:hypothetical protein
MLHRASGGMLVLCYLAVVGVAGCSRSVEQKPAAMPPAGRSTGPVANARLEDLKWTLPRGWKAEYNRSTLRWKVQKNVPPDYPCVVAWTLLPGQEPAGLIDFSHRLQTSSALTEGAYILDRVTEQSEYPGGYYLVGKFHPRGQRRVLTLGFAMIRNLGRQRLIFECFKIHDAAQRQEMVDFCKSATF